MGGGNLEKLMTIGLRELIDLLEDAWSCGYASGIIRRRSYMEEDVSKVLQKALAEKKYS